MAKKVDSYRAETTKSGKKSTTSVGLPKSKVDTASKTHVKEPVAQTYANPLAASLHEGLADLVALGVATQDELTSFEKVALKGVPKYTSARVRELRRREKATQAVFAFHLGVSINTVSQWERGEREVSGAAAKLLSLVERYGLAHIL